MAYLASIALRAVSAILESGCRGTAALDQSPPDVFIRHVEELIKGPMLRRVVFPQSKISSLAREDQADEHDLDYVDELNGLVHQGLDAGEQSDHLVFVAPRQARLLPGLEPRGGSGSELR